MAALTPHSDLPAPAVDADALLATLRNALDAHADDDADPRGGTPAGRALLTLAALARSTAAALGADPGTPLTNGPGVVVLRDLAAATRLLDRAVTAAASAAATDELFRAPKAVPAAACRSWPPQPAGSSATWSSSGAAWNPPNGGSTGPWPRWAPTARNAPGS
jgi:hypothetical protein